MTELQQQIAELNEKSFWNEHNKSFFYESCLLEIEKQGFQFEATKEIVELSKKLLNP